MSEMVERLARAMCKRAGGNPDILARPGVPLSVGGKLFVSWGDTFTELLPLWRFFEDDAKAFIAAMRDPTEAMMEAGVEAGASWESEPEDFRASWHAMIDAALK